MLEHIPLSPETKCQQNKGSKEGRGPNSQIPCLSCCSCLWAVLMAETNMGSDFCPAHCTGNFHSNVIIP